MSEEPLSDAEREEILAYWREHRDWPASRLLRKMDEMWQFFFGRMTPEELERYRRVRDEMRKPKPPEGEA